MTAAVLLALACTLSAGAETEKTHPLFNGHDLSGFSTFLGRHGINNDPDKVFSVADGMICISGQEFGYLVTEQEFENYHLTVEFKWGTQTHPPRKDQARDSGILFHVTGPDKVWPQSIEFQLIEGGTGDLIVVGGASLDCDDRLRPRFVPWTKLSSDGKRVVGGQIRCNKHWRERKNTAGFRDRQDLEHPHGQWNVLELIAAGKNIRYVVNGKVALEATGAEPAKGRILFQSEGAEVFFRKIELKPLPPAIPFRIPPGFAVERIAGPPLLEWPMFAGFDDGGRLFVCDSSGFNLLKGRSDILVKDPPHAIRLLEDRDGDGRFDASTLFADKMTFPMGILWYEGALYTASAPSLWRLEDTDGDGVADLRREFITKFEFEGNGCDIHGPFLGPDGRFYWANCNRGFDLRAADGRVLKGKAAGIFRVRPDGSDIEIVCAGGMANPVEVAFTPEGEALATVNILVGAPQPRNDAIIHGIEGGVFPYRNLAASFQRTGEPLPATIDLGWVAPSGLMRYRGDAFGAGYRDNFFSAQFNTHRVQRHVLERAGATFRARTEDFVVGTDPDFHPTDLLEDADGSLLLVDTSGWFLRGCPTSRIAKPEVKGAIYRIWRQGAPGPRDPRGLALRWDDAEPKVLAGRLDDPRWVVRDRAVHHLGKRGREAVPALQVVIHRGFTIRARRSAVWALARLELPEADAAIRDALSDTEASVRLAAAHALGLHRYTDGLEPLAQLAVSDTEPAVRRAAATALGRIGRSAAVPALLAALRAGGDRFLEHAQIYALIKIGDRAATLRGLGSDHPQVQRGTLLAIDQTEGGRLTRELVVPLLNRSDVALQRTAWTVITTHPDWAGAVVSLLRTWLAENAVRDGRSELLKSAVLAFCKDLAMQETVAEALHRDSTELAVRLLLLENIALVPLENLPDLWLAELGRSLQHADERVVLQTVATLRMRRTAGLDDALVRLGKDARRSPEVRVAALAAAAPWCDHLDQDLFDFLFRKLDSARPPLVRRATADALGNARLNDAQLVTLTEAVASAGALELPLLVSAFERSGNSIVGNKLFGALRKTGGLPSLSPAALQRTLQAYPAEVQRAAEPLFLRLHVDARMQQARLAEFEPVLHGGNARRGRNIFFVSTAACATCHTAGTDGGNIGPDLSKIGGIRTGRDLLEAILFPSSSFVRGYEPYVLATSDGRTYNGTLARDNADAVILVTAERSEFRVPRSAIEEIQPSQVSIMPQGLEAQLSRRELSDLIAFLSGLK
jgi:putative membrane-bound dehydrogenase-like protein